MCVVPDRTGEECRGGVREIGCYGRLMLRMDLRVRARVRTFGLVGCSHGGGWDAAAGAGSARGGKVEEVARASIVSGYGYPHYLIIQWDGYACKHGLSSL